MNERKKLARDIFEQAIELESDEERAAFLERACGADHSLRAEVQLLLTAHHDAAGFMEPLDDATRDSPAIERAGAVLGGRFKLLENIGEGGMGSVWVAEQQQPVKRRVAIKLVKAGMDSKQVLARFESERQALAVMDHPNIAKVFDGGMTEQGRPYFVMEYVKGVPFTDYCNQTRLPLRERLDLFILVCQAVQHAHHKGIVHRDLKPSNILICLYDGKPVPKVIDFGLAKAMHQSLTDKSIYTGHGMMVGTPLYMSPEQAEHNNLDVDTRTDIYSLGVILYELLTGSTPLERQQLQKAAIDEVLRLIKEVEPQRPSIRLSGSENLPSIAAQRSIDPRELRRTLTGDLDWIVMKALDKERSRRYETPNGMARDIERFLNDEAVEACPPSRAYRLKKYIRKHRLQVTAMSVVLLAVLIGVGGITWGLFRAVNAEQAATKSEQETLIALADVTKERDAKDEARLAELKQREMAERNLLAGILRPIGFSTNRLDQSELNSLADWSALGDSPLQLLALETALDDPETALRIARRAERVIQACVGLSPTRRAAAIELVSAKQRDRSADPRIRAAACWLALELGSNDLPALAESITCLSKLNLDISQPQEEFAEFLLFAIRRVQTLNAEQVTRGWDKLIDVMEESTNYFVLDVVGKGLAALAARITPEQATRGGDALIRVLEKSTDAFAPKVRVQMIDNRVLEISTDEFTLGAAGQGIVALAPRLTPEQSTRGWDALIELLEKSPNTNIYLDKGLVALAPKLTPEQVIRGGDALIELLEKSPKWQVRFAVSRVLVALAPRLTPEQVTRSSDALIDVLEKSTANMHLDPVVGCLTALAPSMTPEQMSRSSDALIGVLEKSTVDGVLNTAADCLVALASSMTPEQMTRSSDALIGVLEKSTVNGVLNAAGKGLAALAPKLTPEQVTRGWDALISVMEESRNSYVLNTAGKGLAALAPKLTPEQVSTGWDTLIDVMEESTNYYVLDVVGKGLAALAPKLTPEQVSTGWDTLIDVMEESKNSEVLNAAGKGLAALAPKLTPEQVTRGWDTLTGVLEKATDEVVERAANAGLMALALNLPQELGTRGWNALIDILEKSTDAFTLGAAGKGLVALAPKLTAEQVTHGWDTLIGVLENATDEVVINAANPGLLALALNLPPELRTSGWNALIDILEKSTDAFTLGAAGKGLVALAPSLNDKLRLRTAEALIEVLHRCADGDFAEQIAALAPLLDAAYRDRILTEATTILFDFASSSDLFYVSEGRLDYDPMLYGVCGLSDPKSLAILLSHPGCADEPREFMLQRFEELLFHNGKHVFLALPKSDSETQASDQAQPVPPPRRFHNLHDAATWIQQNWPDFDLETNHPVTGRGDR